jgi:hypothetical protein
VAFAGARGVVDAATGGRLGPRATDRTSRDLVYRGEKPEPGNWFEKWMEYNGAGHAERHAAAVFVRQMGVSAVLLGLTQATEDWLGKKINFGVYGVAPQFVALLWTLRQFFPNDQSLKEWYDTGVYDASVNFARGIPMAPTIALAADIAKETSGKVASAGKSPGKHGPAWYFPWESTLNAVRKTLVTGDVEIQRIIRENPEKFEGFYVPWDIKKAEYGLAPEEKVLHHVGLSTPADDRRNERRVPR